MRHRETILIFTSAWRAKSKIFASMLLMLLNWHSSVSHTSEDKKLAYSLARSNLYTAVKQQQQQHREQQQDIKER